MEPVSSLVPATIGSRPSYQVAIVEPDGRLLLRLGSSLPGAVRLATIEDLVQGLGRGRPVVAVFGPSLATEYGFQAAHRLTTSYPELGAVYCVDTLSTDLLQHALRAGARDAVELRDGGGALSQSVARVGELLAGAPARVPAVPGASTAGPGRLVVVFSPKGGVGKSTVAVNVAAAMAQRTDARVALVDVDLQFGDVAVMLGVPPQQTVVDAVAAAQYLDAELMASLVTRHSSGVLVLPAPLEPVHAEMLGPDEVVSVCDALRAISGYVVVDAPTAFDDTTVALVEAADEVLLVASMDIPSIKNLRIGLRALDLQSIAGTKLRLVLNRASAQVKLDVREIEQVLGLRADYPIPYDVAVPVSVNAGVPVVVHDPRAPAARALANIAEKLLGPDHRGAGDQKRRGRRGRRRR